MSLLKTVLYIFTVVASTTALSQKIDYGKNSAAGGYFDVGNCKLYFEVYGKGKPIVLLHGGVYGYIDEFEPLIDRLSKTHKVICIATRGHGRSEIGHVQFSYDQRAEDAYKVVRSITTDSVAVLGFSDGGFAALKLAAMHPEMVNQLIVIGAGDLPKIPKGKERYERYSSKNLLKSAREFFEARLSIMPEPNRWDECLEMLNKMYDSDFVSEETFSKIKCSTLLMAGDKDEYSTIDDFVKCKRAISNAQLAIIPGCGHVVFYCNLESVWAAIAPFLKK